jgi:transcriptional regulator
MPPAPADYLQGMLELIVLRALAGGPMHGYAIARWIESATDNALAVEEGSLYPALYRMERRRWIEAEWGTSELGRRAKFYRLTRAGRRQLADGSAAWQAFAAMVGRLLKPASPRPLGHESSG